MFYLFRLFYSFLPLHNPIGFGATDFVELTFALLLVVGVLAWQKLADRVKVLALKTLWCMAILAVLPVGLRLLCSTLRRFQLLWAPMISAICCWAILWRISG